MKGCQWPVSPLTLFCPRGREHPTLPDAPQLWSPGNPTFPTAEFEAETLTVSLPSELLTHQV